MTSDTCLGLIGIKLELENDRLKTICNNIIAKKWVNKLADDATYKKTYVPQRNKACSVILIKNAWLLEFQNNAPDSTIIVKFEGGRARERGREGGREPNLNKKIEVIKKVQILDESFESEHLKSGSSFHGQSCSIVFSHITITIVDFFLPILFYSKLWRFWFE